MIKIGGASAMWGDSLFSVEQLLKVEGLNYLMLEGLAEITMAILTRAKQKNPSLGYAVDFIDPILANNISLIKEKGVKVITNSGGVNPIGAAKHLAQICQNKGIELKIVAITGDDLMIKYQQIRQKGLNNIELPESSVLSMNAYLGAFPIAQALTMGADIVITGRCVDSALALGPLIYEFGWKPTDLDLLAQGSLAGHLIECGAQSTGGLMTDWDSYDSWENMGYPVIECEANGNFVLTKLEGTTGIVNKASVGEQLVYEIGDPAAYLLPDVVCDFTQVSLEEIGKDRVKVTGAKGKNPPPTYKAIAQQVIGYRITYVFLIIGRDLEQKAERLTKNIRTKFEKILANLGKEPFVDFNYELLGSESNFGANKEVKNNRESVLKISAQHNDREALELFSKELPSIGVSTIQSLCTGITGRQSPTPMIRPLSYLINKAEIDHTIKLNLLDGQAIDYNIPQNFEFEVLKFNEGDVIDENIENQNERVEVPLISIAYARSGDKGNSSNIGVIARSKEFYDYLNEALTANKVKHYFSHFVKGNVYRYSLPGILAYNFLLNDSLAGGGTASLRFDAQGKGLGQNLLEMKIKVPKEFTKHPAYKPLN